MRVILPETSREAAKWSNERLKGLYYRAICWLIVEKREPALRAQNRGSLTRRSACYPEVMIVSWCDFSLFSIPHLAVDDLLVETAPITHRTRERSLLYSSVRSLVRFGSKRGVS